MTGGRLLLMDEARWQLPRTVSQQPWALGSSVHPLVLEEGLPRHPPPQGRWVGVRGEGGEGDEREVEVGREWHYSALSVVQ